ncbi:MAG: hypothetical protein AVDCRST_MAG42-3043 [uncultured Chthoniobacterales bacterium]|uniref:Uncharacterized protein n=1 Tax=uncultured Chthoniobacterales bacterium TaxID=1836801 RepID=A0A6J4J4R9_9BACT|nr:MAG: hypothetical protein AVDCRST_MAG42-3043 [uncultured Chthoniobacterales bacterium]
MLQGSLAFWSAAVFRRFVPKLAMPGNTAEGSFSRHRFRLASRIHARA